MRHTDSNQSYALRTRKPTPILLALLAALALLATGCVHKGSVHAHPRPAHHSHAKVVTVKTGHVHSVRCGHYRHEGRWYHLAGHVHGKRCGHVKVRGVWVIRH